MALGKSASRLAQDWQVEDTHMQEKKNKMQLRESQNHKIQGWEGPQQPSGPTF